MSFKHLGSFLVYEDGSVEPLDVSKFFGADGKVKAVPCYMLDEVPESMQGHRAILVFGEKAMVIGDWPNEVWDAIMGVSDAQGE